MYMRLLGYPPHKITILTTYNGQKHLIRDVLAKRCASNPVFGMPDKVGRDNGIFFFSKKYFECLVNVVLHRSLLDLSYCYYKH